MTRVAFLRAQIMEAVKDGGGAIVSIAGREGEPEALFLDTPNGLGWINCRTNGFTNGRDIRVLPNRVAVRSTPHNYGTEPIVPGHSDDRAPKLSQFGMSDISRISSGTWRISRLEGVGNRLEFQRKVQDLAKKGEPKVVRITKKEVTEW
jgi:hypothetical protein